MRPLLWIHTRLVLNVWVYGWLWFVHFINHLTNLHSVPNNPGLCLISNPHGWTSVGNKFFFGCSRVSRTLNHPPTVFCLYAYFMLKYFEIHNIRFSFRKFPLSKYLDSDKICPTGTSFSFSSRLCLPPPCRNNRLPYFLIRSLIWISKYWLKSDVNSPVQSRPVW